MSLPGVENVRHKDVNTVVIRENTEGEYSGIEHEVYPGVIESIKVTTMAASLKVYKYQYHLFRLLNMPLNSLSWLEGRKSQLFTRPTL
jgi:isocitrate dehydrogenase (NAD+)